MIIHLSNENFNEEIKEGLVLVDFYADWCGPCKMLSPIIEEFAKEHLDVKVIKINVDEHEDLAREYGVMSIPTIILFKDGSVAKKTMGFVPKEILVEWIK